MPNMNNLKLKRVEGFNFDQYDWSKILQPPFVKQRVAKTYADNTKELYHYDEAGQLIAVANSTGVVQREYIYNGNQLVGFVNNYATINPILLAAASATFQGSHVLSTAQTGYTGATGFIDVVNEGQINWALTIVSASTYDIKVRYSLAATNRPLDVLVDGVKKYA